MNKGCSEIDKAILIHKIHRKMKSEIGPRLHVARVLVRRYYKDKQKLTNDYDFSRYCEAILDNVLCRYNYDIELIIDNWRKVTPILAITPLVCEACGYRPLFCRCD